MLSIIFIILSSVFLGCVQQQPPVATPTPTPTETIKPTVVPTTPVPVISPTPAPNLFPVEYRVWVDSDYGFTVVRAVNGTNFITLPSGFDVLNFTIQAGDKVKWINDDSYDFPLTIVSNEGLWENRTGYLRWKEDKFVYTFNKTGSYTFSVKEYKRIKSQKINVNP